MIQAKLFDIKLAVKNLEESVEFYRNVFSWLGFSSGRYWDDPYDNRKTYTLGLFLIQWFDPAQSIS